MSHPARNNYPNHLRPVPDPEIEENPQLSIPDATIFEKDPAWILRTMLVVGFLAVVAAVLWSNRDLKTELPKLAAKAEQKENLQYADNNKRGEEILAKQEALLEEFKKERTRKTDKDPTVIDERAKVARLTSEKAAAERKHKEEVKTLKDRAEAAEREARSQKTKVASANKKAELSEAKANVVAKDSALSWDEKNEVDNLVLVAISKQESRHNYDSLGPEISRDDGSVDQAVGRWQILRSRIPRVSKMKLGRVVDLEEFRQNEEIQKAVAGGSILDQWHNEAGGHIGKMAALHHRGKPNWDSNASDGYMTTREYAIQVACTFGLSRPDLIPEDMKDVVYPRLAAADPVIKQLWERRQAKMAKKAASAKKKVAKAGQSLKETAKALVARKK